jgi:pimeloyl-ACP methyl ester carboxylesterase
MLWMARLFASEGMAVLTYDKRGVGKSGGTFVGGMPAGSATNLDLLAQDAAAAAAAMSQHPRLRGTPLGYVGLSQGGWIGPLAATRPPAVSFMVFFSGPVTTVAEQSYFSDLTKNDPDFWKTRTPQEVALYMSAAPNPPDDLDPRAALSQLYVPAFWAFGGRDHITPADLSIVRLQELIAAGQSQYEYTLSAEHGHELIVYDFSRMSLSKPFGEGVDWIKRTVGGPAQ